MTKVCKNPECHLKGREQPLMAFSHHSGCKQNVKSICKICWNRKSRSRWRSDPDYRAARLVASNARELKRKYNITLEEKESILNSQNRRCANNGCKSSEPGGIGQWHMDHCHDTGLLRGVLCHGCNTGTGISDDVGKLRGKIEYLEWWNVEHARLQSETQAA